jgi:hypothetical protein
MQHLAAAFGAPQRLETESGPLYRWVLRRARGADAHVYITLDSPELPDLAHVLISDPGAKTINPITALTIRTMPEADRLVALVKQQVESPSEPA